MGKSTMVLPAPTIRGIEVRAVDAPLDPPLVIATVRTVQGVTGTSGVGRDAAAG